MEREYRELQHMMEIAELRVKGIQDQHLLEWNFKVAEDTRYIQMANPFLRHVSPMRFSIKVCLLR